MTNGLLPIRMAAGAALALWIGSLDAAAQDWDPGPGGVCPPPDMYDAGPARDDIFVTADDESRAAWTRGLQIVWPEVALYDTPQRIRAIDGPLLEFGERVQILTRSEVLPDALLAMDRVRGRCGWLRELDLMSLTKSLEIIQLPGWEDETGLDGAPLRLKAKVVVRAARDASGNVLRVPIFTAPSGIDVFQRGELDYFTVADVFRTEREGGGTCSSLRDDDCYLLLGGTQLIDGVTIPNILGWVKSTDVELWPTSISLFFAPGSADVPVYLDECQAKFAGTGRRCGPAAIAPLATGGYREVKGQNIPRFPVINAFQGQAEGLPEGLWVYQIVTALQVCSEDGRGECRSAVELEEAIAERGQGLKLLQTADIVFVIDASESMERYFGAVVEAAVAFSEALVGSGIKPRFAAVVYSDYEEEVGIADTVSIETIAEFGDPGDPTPLYRLTDTDDVQRRVLDIHKDLPEAPYAALVKTLEPGFLDWSPDAGIRLVIWIGDIGNRDPGDSPAKGPFPIVTENVDAETVAAAVLNALPEDSRSTLVMAAINVPGRGGDEARTDFLSDYNDVLRILHAEGECQLPARTVSASSGDAKGEIRALLDELVNIIATGEAVSTPGARVADIWDEPEDSCGVIGGDSPLLAAGVSEGSLPAFRVGVRVAKDLGILAGESGGLAEGEVLAVESYYVRQDFRPGSDGQKFQYWIGLRVDELVNLSNAMTGFCDKLETFTFANELNVAYGTVLESVTRDRLPETMTPAEFLEIKLSVPKEDFSPLLQQYPTEWFDRIIGDPAELRDFRERICVKAQLINYVRQGKRVDESDLMMEGGRVVLREGVVLEDFAWDWIPANGIRYYFFPLEFLP